MERNPKKVLHRAQKWGFRLGKCSKFHFSQGAKTCQIAGVFIINRAVGICVKETGRQQESGGWREFRLKKELCILITIQ